MAKNGFTTSIVHSDRRSGVAHGAIHKPMHPSTEYAFADSRELAAVFQGKAGFTYSRQGTPTTASLEDKVTHMEEGIGTVTFASGMAALAATFFSLFKAGDHLISSQHIFGNTNSLLGTLEGLGVELSFVDASNADNIRPAIKPNTRMVFVETLANPGTQVADLQGIGELCTDKGLVYVVDGTLTSPLLFKGRDVGASLVVNSLSKHIGGHGNALGGSVTNTGLYDWSSYANIAEPYRKGNPLGWGLTQIKKKGLRDMGGTLSSEAAHRIAAGAETLAMRMDRICSNALALAKYLESHPRVHSVRYPGLPSHAQHERASALFGNRFGGLMGIELASDIDVFDFLNRLQVLALATHLGDNRTLVLPMAQTIYYEMGPERRAEMGISDTFLRMSVGIEDIEDLIGDFEQALAES